MKIVMLIPELRMGGAQRSFVKVARSFSIDHDVTIVLFNKDLPIDFEVNQKVISLNVAAGNSIIEKLSGLLKRYLRLKEVVNSLNPDIVLSYLEGANILNALMPKKIYRIISQRGSVLNDETMTGKWSWLRKNFLIKYLYPHASSIVALNNNIRQELESVLFRKTKIHVIENLFDINTIIQQSNEELQFNFMNSKRKWLCCVGRIAHEKGFHHVINILHALKTKTVKCGLVIVGDGPQMDNLKQLCKNLELTYDDTLQNGKADVFFTGKQANPFSIIKKADFLLISSSSEGGPNVLTEAMICQTLVVSANCPAGPREKLSPDKIIPFTINKPVITNHGVLMPVFQQPEVAPIYEVWCGLLYELMLKSDFVDKIVQNAFVYARNFNEDIIYEKWVRAIEKR